MSGAVMRVRSAVATLSIKAALFLFGFAVLSLAILHRPDWKLRDFDQVLYVTIAYDLDKHGVFGNGIFDPVNSAAVPPRPGMFFGPVFPAVVFAAMKLDPRFAQAVRCSVESDRGHTDESRCEAYARPIRLFNAFCLAAGLLAVASAAELMFRRKRSVFVLTGLFALAALANQADIFSFVMTESLIFAIYSIFAWAFLRALMMGRTLDFAIAGGLLGLLCLTKPSFLVLLPVALGAGIVYGVKIATAARLSWNARALVFISAFACVIGPWLARNYLSVGKLGLTEEYGSVAIVERFAYDDMTAREVMLAFPYCTPVVGNLAFDKHSETDIMHRFLYYTPDSFFHVGRDRRDALIRQYGRIDPLIGTIVADEMRSDWWRYLLVGIPLAWCGMWAGGGVTLLLLPLFVWSLIRAARKPEPLMLLYSAPPLLMLGLHAAVADGSTRYNIILIGPYSIGAARVILSALPLGALASASWRARTVMSSICKRSFK
jgi:hypothetical protein